MSLRRLLFVNLFAASALVPFTATAQEQALDIYSAFEPPAGETEAPDGESVFDAINAALAHNPQIDIAQSRRDAAKADRFQAFGQFLPEIEASASYTDDSWRSDSLQTLQDRDGTTIGITASQPIFQGLAAINRYREAKNRYSQSDFALIAAQEQTALEAARIHAAVMLARGVVEHRITNLTLLNKQFEIAERRMKAGAQSRTGVEQARMRYAQAQVELGEARAVLAQREASYARIIGHYPSPEFAAYDGGEVIDFSSVAEAQNVALSNNPSLGAARAGVAAAKNAKNAAKGEFAPRLSLEGSYFKRYGEDEMLAEDDEEYQLVARMRMPIFNQGRNIAALRSTKASVAEESALLTNTRLAVEEVVFRSWRQAADASVRRQAAANAIEAAEMSVKGLQIEYEAGRRSVIDVLDGQRDLVTARISLSQAEHDHQVAQYELAAATGMILSLANEKLARAD